jgi:hypothetical protein
MKYLFWIFSLFIFCTCMKRGAHCDGTVLSKYNYGVPYAFVSVEVYKHSNSKLRSKVSDTTDRNGYFNLLYAYEKGDAVKLSIQSDSGKLNENLSQKVGPQVFHVQ